MKAVGCMVYAFRKIIRRMSSDIFNKRSEIFDFFKRNIFFGGIVFPYLKVIPNEISFSKVACLIEHSSPLSHSHTLFLNIRILNCCFQLLSWSIKKFTAGCDKKPNNYLNPLIRSNSVLEREFKLHLCWLKIIFQIRNLSWNAAHVDGW